jgi:serpin B
MKKFILSIFICFIAQLSFGQNITEGNNKFALNLFQKLANGSDNTFYSPYSISTALFMTTGGAKSETEKQMLDVLCQTGNTAEYHKKFGEHIALVEKKEKIQLNIANSIWMQKGFKFQQPFIDLLNSAYKAKLNESNFASNPDGEAKKINKWVEGKTKDKIKNLIAPGVLKSNTRMVLVNAIYFYGEWNKAFKKEDTKADDFYLSNNSTIKADFMHAEYNMKYATDGDFELLSIPYMKGEASMLVFLPKSKTDFDKAIKSLSYEKYASLLGKLGNNKVNLSFPKFTMTAQFELSQTLSEMGMPLSFSDMADFSGMTGQKDLKINKVIHKAFVDVSEKGTEAAGATAVIVTTKSAMPDREPIIYFKADHPFIFMINDNTTGQILFVGVVNKPGK